MKIVAPSRRIILPLVALIIAIGGISIVYYYSERSPSEAKAPLEVKDAPALLAQQIEEIDSDKDGLKDWEEVLWNTSPKKADSDSDGTSDGDEVKTGRNPSVSGPNDTVTNDQSVGIIASSTTKFNEQIPENLTETDKISRQLLTDYLAAKQSGTPFNDLDKEALVNKVISAAQNIKIDQKTFTADDLTTTPAEDNDSLKKYGMEVRAVVSSTIFNIKGVEGGDLVIIEKAVQTEDPDEIVKLLPIENALKASVAGMSSIKVPESALTVHLNLLNNIEKMRASIHGVISIFEDTLTGMAAFRDYFTASSDFTTQVNEFNNFFSERGITF